MPARRLQVGGSTSLRCNNDHIYVIGLEALEVTVYMKDLAQSKSSAELAVSFAACPFLTGDRPLGASMSGQPASTPGLVCGSLSRSQGPGEAW